MHWELGAYEQRRKRCRSEQWSRRSKLTIARFGGVPKRDLQLQGWSHASGARALQGLLRSFDMLCNLANQTSSCPLFGLAPIILPPPLSPPFTWDQTFHYKLIWIPSSSLTYLRNSLFRLNQGYSSSPKKHLFASSRCPHKQLDSSAGQVRFLKLYPAKKQSDTISCELIDSLLSDTPSYEALSYRAPKWTLNRSFSWNII